MKIKSAVKIYHGWWVALACFLMNASLFVVLVSLPGLFTVPVTEDLGFPRASFNISMSLLTVAALVGNLFSAKLFIRYNEKILMGASCLLIVVMFIWKSAATHLWEFCLSSLISGILCVFTGQVVISILITNWFGKKLRGKVTGIVQAGSAIGASILSPIISSVNETFGWRTGYLVMGGLVLAVIPALLICVRKTPAEMGLVRVGDAEETNLPTEMSGVQARDAVRSPAFLFTGMAFFICSTVGMFYSSNIQSHMISLGHSMVSAGSVVSLGFGAMVVGKIILGTASDKWGIQKAATVSLFVEMIGCVLLALSYRFPGLEWPGIIFFGLGNSVTTVGAPLVILEHFGAKDYGTIFGYTNVATTLGATVAPVLGGLVYDLTNSYLGGWVISLIMVALSAVLLVASYRARRTVCHENP